MGACASILSSTCALVAKLEAWCLFPEHKRPGILAKRKRASATSAHQIQFAEYDLENPLKISNELGFEVYNSAMLGSQNGNHGSGLPYAQ
jgi:hypothetical protein